MSDPDLSTLDATRLAVNTFRRHIPNTRSATEAWLGELNVTFVDVWFYDSRMRTWIDERHVDDPATLDATIVMTMGRLRLSYALHTYHGRWRLLTGWRGDRRGRESFRYFDSREAAEMLAIHGA